MMSSNHPVKIDPMITEVTNVPINIKIIDIRIINIKIIDIKIIEMVRKVILQDQGLQSNLTRPILLKEILKGPTLREIDIGVIIVKVRRMIHGEMIDIAKVRRTISEETIDIGVMLELDSTDNLNSPILIDILTQSLPIINLK